MLYNKINYTANISYLSNTFIYEYDISKCNINVLYTKGVINKSTYDYLYDSERMVRQVYVGKLIRDNPSINDVLKAGIIEAKQMLFEQNAIDDRDVLSIKNDAVFIINKRLGITKFGLIEFALKHVYTAYYKIKNMEYYYYYNSMTKEECLDIKGISDSVLPYHEKHFFQLLKDVFYTVQTSGIEVAVRLLKDAYMDYITLTMPIEYYREFNIESQYHLKFNTRTGAGFCTTIVTDEIKDMIDISHNASILLEIQKILISMYFNKNR